MKLTAHKYTSIESSMSKNRWKQAEKVISEQADADHGYEEMVQILINNKFSKQEADEVARMYGREPLAIKDKHKIHSVNMDSKNGIWSR